MTRSAGQPASQDRRGATSSQFAYVELDRRTLLRGALGASLSVALGAPGHASATVPAVTPGEVAFRWFDLALALSRDTPGCTPPVVARALGHLGLALHEAVAAGDGRLCSLAGRIEGIAVPGRRVPAGAGPAYTALVASRTLFQVTQELYATPSGSAAQACKALDQSLTPRLRDSLTPWSARRAVVDADRLSAVVLERARRDGGHDGHLRPIGGRLEPPPGNQLWAPTPPAHLPALHPGWGKVQTFVPGLVGNVRLAPPVPWSADPQSPFGQQALAVLAAVHSGTEQDRRTALFWSDDPGATVTPAGHWMAIALQVLRARRAASLEVAQVLGLLGIALADAFVSCWATKYRCLVQRPVTWVSRHADPNWSSRMPLTTPPFPEYTSGHSVASAAAARVLTDLLGAQSFSDRTHVARGMAPRRFDSFEQAAQEAAGSRVLGGIHYPFSVEEGLRQGEQVGAAVVALATPERRS